MAVSAGIGSIIIDNYEEVARLERICAAHGRNQRVLFRVKPGVSAHTHEFIMVFCLTVSGLCILFGFLKLRRQHQERR